jgi:sphinganine-1-phosphate aldolase
MSPKGASALLFKTIELRHFVYFTKVDWTGGLYVTAGFAGSRTISPIAGAWFAMVSIGSNG